MTKNVQPTLLETPPFECEIVAEQESLKLIHAKGHGWAVVEIRNGRVLSFDRAERREAEADAAGIIEVVGSDGWLSEDDARTRLSKGADIGEDLAKKIW